jgi:hypothetical protein
MKKLSDAKHSEADEDLEPEHRFDYRKARPNRFAPEAKRIVLLDADVAEVFTEPEQVNAVLRALIATMPRPATRLK